MTEPRTALAHRLRDLRRGRKLTQADLARALGVSVAAISSWESETNTLVPTENRISELSLFYASDRPVTKDGAALVPEEELTADERARRDELLDELSGLRMPAGPLAAPGGGRWYFPDGGPVRVICGRLDGNPADPGPADPDYARLAHVADLDAVLELYGHLRATNPANPDIRVCTGDELTPDDLTGHLVVLGGARRWDPRVRDLVDRLELPVSQVDRHFEVGGKQRYAAEVVRRDGQQELRSDVALFYRGPNPYHRRRTLTLLSGGYGRGTYAAVRALTDDQFREHNEAYLARRFPDGTAGLLVRVQVPAGAAAVTPDWTDPPTRLYEWPDRT